MTRIIEVDPARNLEHDAAGLAQGGAIAVYARTTAPVQQSWGLMAATARIAFVLVYTMPDASKRAAIEDITAVLQDRTLSELPAIRFELGHTGAAHDAVKSGVVGKVLIDVDTKP